MHRLSNPHLSIFSRIVCHWGRDLWTNLWRDKTVSCWSEVWLNDFVCAKLFSVSRREHCLNKQSAFQVDRTRIRTDFGEETQATWPCLWRSVTSRPVSSPINITWHCTGFDQLRLLQILCSSLDRTNVMNMQWREWHCLFRWSCFACEGLRQNSRFQAWSADWWVNFR